MALKSATLYLWIYSGNFDGTNKDVNNPTYTLYKEAAAGQNVINFEIADLVSDYISINFDGTYESLRQSVWVDWKIPRTDENDDEILPLIEGSGLAYDGYGYFKDGINPDLVGSSQLMQSNLTVYVPTGENPNVPVFTGLGGASGVNYIKAGQTIYSEQYESKILFLTADSTEITADMDIYTADRTVANDVDSEQSTQATSIAAPDEIVILNNNGTDTTVKIKYIDEAKYTPQKVWFVNKFGVVQELWFFKRKDESINISKESYKENTIAITNNEIGYSINTPTDMPYNFKAQKSLKLNTGFVVEEFNEVIQQLMLTKNAWTKENNQVLPIVPKTSSLAYKTSLNDKLINFTVEFDYAFNEVNTIR
jgi:hypothetical protein